MIVSLGDRHTYVEGESLAWAGYAHYLADLTGMQIAERPQPAADLLVYRLRNGSALDLVNHPDHADLPWEHRESRLAHYVARSAHAVLHVDHPAWPLRHLLLVIRHEPTDLAASRWAVRLAKLSGAIVTILPLSPTIPAIYTAEPGLEFLLAPNTPQGARLRELVYEIAEQEIVGQVHIQHGTPQQQILAERNRTFCDLAIIGAETHGLLHRWFMGELVTPLLRCLGCSLLVAKQESPQQAGHA